MHAGSSSSGVAGVHDIAMISHVLVRWVHVLAVQEDISQGYNYACW